MIMFSSKEKNQSISDEIQNSDNKISKMYVDMIDILPSVDLASEDAHPISPVSNIDWDWVASNAIENNKNKDDFKKELIQKYIVEGNPFKYSIYINTFKPCEKCGKNIGSIPIIYIISAKENLLIRTSYKKLHDIKDHGASFSEEEIQLFKKILGK